MTAERVAAPPGYTVLEGAGFNAYVGPVWRAPDGKSFLLEVRDIHMNGGGAIHGGMAMALAGIVMGGAVRDALDGAAAAAVSMTADFIGPVKLGDRLEGRASITRRTRTIVFVSCELGVNGKPALTASGIWKVAGGQ